MTHDCLMAVSFYSAPQRPCVPSDEGALCESPIDPEFADIGAAPSLPHPASGSAQTAVYDKLEVGSHRSSEAYASGFLPSSLYKPIAPPKHGGQTRYGFTPQFEKNSRMGEECEESLNETYHRHRSSWHAALNKRIINQPSADSILNITMELMQGLDLQNLVTSISCISQSRDGVRCRRDPRFMEILYRLESLWDRGGFTVAKEEYEDVDISHFASVAAALARMQPSKQDGTMQRILRVVASEASQEVSVARPIDLTLLAWAFATLVQRPRTLVLAVASEATQKIGEFTEQHISNTTWAFAKLDVRYDPWLTAMIEETFTRLPHLSPQHVSNIVWALGRSMIKSEAKIGHDSWRLLSALATLAGKRIEEFDAQSLSNISWSVSRLGMAHDFFMGRLLVVVPAKLAHYPSLDITNLAYSFAKMGYSSPELRLSLQRESNERFSEFSGGEVGRLVWSLDQLGPLDVGWLDAAAARFLDCWDTASAKKEGWAALHIANCAAVHGQSLRSWRRVEQHFFETIYKPTLTSLEHLKIAPDTDVEAYVAKMQKMVTDLDIDHVGPHYTRPLLWELGFTDPAHAPAHALGGNAPSLDWASPFVCVPRPLAWIFKGRAAAEAAVVCLKAGLSEESLMFDRFGPHERRIVCWFAFDFLLHVNGRGLPLREDGRVAFWIGDEGRALNLRGESTFAYYSTGGAGAALASAAANGTMTLEDVKRAQDWLPGLFAQHERMGHCERQAFLEVLLRIVVAVRHSTSQEPDALSTGRFDGSGGVAVEGFLQLYVVHFCCISCLSVLCHVARRLPGVRLHVEYDDCWRTRVLDT